MIVSIMQPYLLPYIGYFQLIAASDVFVIYDDVQYMKGGWINRNRVLLNGAPHWLTMPVAHSPLHTLIRDKDYLRGPAADAKAAGLLHQAYRKAPCFAAGQALAAEIFASPQTNVARFNAHAIGLVCQALGVETKVVWSSDLGRDATLGGQDAVLDICRRLGASTYLNAPGGVGLYQGGDFARAGLQLSFIAPRPPAYAQFGTEHVPNLSIIDALMFCAPDACAELLRAYDIVIAGQDALA
ncbi:WbqC family protein [Phenylobacterium sp.]|uniref:WbqC family protein n=1 Tax=Phenylobacterium sp. TaxID=1871053 RepID=UPI0035B1FCB9